MWFWALLIILFWAVVPGLITGWMLRERGRRFLPGLVLGAVCGPAGILAALAFIYVSDRRRARRRPQLRGLPVRIFYEVPVVGSLHVTTVWALAGLATFFCVWMIGGIAYEFSRNGLVPAASENARSLAAEAPKANSLLATNSPAGRQASESRSNAQAQGGTPAQARAALLGGLPAQPARPAQEAAGSEESAASGRPDAPGAGSPAALATQPETRATSPAPSASNPPAPTPPPKAQAHARAEAVAAATRELAAGGHRAYAALSGDGQTTTLSLSGATLTRAAGNQLLGNARLRGTLKAAGIRIVVVLNGEDSWTYIL